MVYILYVRTYKPTVVTADGGAAVFQLPIFFFFLSAVLSRKAEDMAQVFNIFADDRIDHSKMVKQLLLNQNPPLARAKSNSRPASGNHNGATKPPITKPKGNKAAVQQVKEEINKTTRYSARHACMLTSHTEYF